jgi:hypothetical protein
MPSVTRYMWYGSNTTGTYNTTDPFSAGELISDQVDLSGFSSPFYLEFWSWAITENSTSFDRKSVSISSDGGSTWNYVLDVPDTADWTNYKLDISGYNSSTFRVKFTFNTTDDVENDYHGWMIDNIKINTGFVVVPGNFNLWIDQDTVANVGEVGSMDFYAHSNFTHNMNVSIGIEINLPNGTIDYVFYDDPVLITADFTWNYLLAYQFTIVGIHDVYFYLIDDIGVFWEAYCSWDIVEDDGYFDLWINQDYETVVDHLIWMDLNVDSYFTHSMFANLSVIIESPGGTNTTIYENLSSVFIEAYGSWYYSISYVFESPGYYSVWFILIDDNGKEWFVDCWWEVHDHEFFDIYVNQDNYAGVGETKSMDFEIDSFFDHAMTVEIQIWLKTPTGEVSLYQNASVYIGALGSWYLSLDHTFTIAGHYDVDFVLIDDIDFHWFGHCWWEVYEGEYFALFLEQEHHGFVGDLLWLDAEVNSNFSVGQIVTIDLAVILPNETLIPLYYNNSYYLASYDYWFLYTDILAEITGHYLVQLIVTDSTGVQWRADCWWDIQEYDEFYLWIEQDNFAKLNEERWMKFKLDSTFDDMEEVSVEIYIETPSGLNETHLKNDSIMIPGWGHWDFELPYTFTMNGNYTVYFIVTDEFDNEWIFSCWWVIGDDNPQKDPYITVEGPDSVKVNETFIIKGTIHAGDQILDVFSVKLVVDGNLIEERNLSIHLTPSSTKTVEFTASISFEGNFSVVIRANTDKGELKDDYQLSVSLPSNDTTTPTNGTTSETDGSKTEPSVELTPGFEGLFVFLWLIPITIALKKRK